MNQANNKGLIDPVREAGFERWCGVGVRRWWSTAVARGMTAR